MVTRTPIAPSDYRSSDDPLGIEGVDSVEMVVGNARQAAFYYASAFGFQPIAYRGPETGMRDVATYLLESRKIRILLSTPLVSEHEYTKMLSRHGDFVRDIAFAVDNCEAFYQEALKRGAQSFEAPVTIEDEHGMVRRAAIRTYGDVLHSIVERGSYHGTFEPGFQPYENFFAPLPAGADVRLAAVDHIVGNVELGAMNQWVEWYERVLGFTEMLHFSDEQISTEYSSLMSKVLRNGTGKIKFPINEPAQGKRRSQIEEYLHFHNGPGVQHIALITGDIVSTVTELRRRGVSFLRVPKTYYDELPSRVGEIREKLTDLAELGILVDKDDDGYLLQIFTKPVEDRPTLFFEIIQRRGSQGFGAGNFKALFEAIEREQEMRGNL